MFDYLVASRALLGQQLSELRRHEVYRIWNQRGGRIYVGQQTKGGVSRVVTHLTGRGGSEVQEHLEELLYTDKESIYVETIYTNLTEREANTLETIHIAEARLGNNFKVKGRSLLRGTYIQI